MYATSNNQVIRTMALVNDMVILAKLSMEMEHLIDRTTAFLFSY